MNFRPSWLKQDRQAAGAQARQDLTKTGKVQRQPRQGKVNPTSFVGPGGLGATPWRGGGIGSLSQGEHGCGERSAVLDETSGGSRFRRPKACWLPKVGDRTLFYDPLSSQGGVSSALGKILLDWRNLPPPP